MLTLQSSNMVNKNKEKNILANNLISLDHLNHKNNNRLDTGEIFTPKRHIQRNTFTCTQTIGHKTQRIIFKNENNTSLVDNITLYTLLSRKQDT